MSEETLDRLTAIVQRDLGADALRVGAADDLLTDHEIECELPDGRRIIAVFAEPPPDRDARRRRLEMIVASFPGLAKGLPAAKAPVRSLGDELAAVSERAGALHAVVIDATSPVVWGADHASAPREELDVETAKLFVLEPLTLELLGGKGFDPEQTAVNSVGLDDPASSTPPAEEDTQAPREPMAMAFPPANAAQGAEGGDLWWEYLLVKKAITAVRALPAIPSLKKGEHLHESVREEAFGYYARSFATIYVLILVFDGPFEELRVERAVAHALPAIERLVLALPPLDPPPKLAGVVAIRRARTRRR
jgi:hypothetical protein